MAATRASGALLQSRKRAYAESVRTAPAAAVTTPPVKTPTMSARDSQARQRRRASARRNSQTAVIGRHRPARMPAGRCAGSAALRSYADSSGAGPGGQSCRHPRHGGGVRTWGRRRRRYALRRITAGSIRTSIRPGSAADEDGVSRLNGLQADTRQGGRTCSRLTHVAIFDWAEASGSWHRLVRTCAHEVNCNYGRAPLRSSRSGGASPANASTAGSGVVRPWGWQYSG